MAIKAFEAATSNQARYLARCVSMLRELQRARHASTAHFLQICQREAGFIISGQYCAWSTK